MEGNVSLVIAEFQRSLVPPGDPRIAGVRGRDFLGKRFERVRLTKKTPGHLVDKISAQPIPDERLQDPIRDVSPLSWEGCGQEVAWGFQSWKQTG